MSFEYLLGFAVGFGLVVLLSLFLHKGKVKGGSARLSYDERQELVRGKGYKYAFFTEILYMVFYLAVSLMDKPFLNTDIGMFLGICIGVLVYASYCIWNEGYFAVNENPKTVLAIFLVVGIANFAGGISHVLEGDLIKDGALTYQASNLICAILLLIIVVEILLKSLYNKKED